MSPSASTALALIALGLALGAIVLATIANRRWARRPVQVGGRGQADTAVAVSALAELRGQVAALGTHVEDLSAQSATVRADVAALQGQVMDLAVAAGEAAAAGAAGDPTALRHVALVRYDAFADVGGRLSYSVALLDDTGSGLVLTTLAGKADVRTYVRTISAGAPDGSLTAEEQQAIDAAVGSRQ